MGGGGEKARARRGGGYANTLKMFSAADCYLCVCLSFLNVVRLTESNNECLPFLFSLSFFFVQTRRPPSDSKLLLR